MRSTSAASSVADRAAPSQPAVARTPTRFRPCAPTSSTTRWSPTSSPRCATIDTDSPTFRRLADELVTLLAYEATRDVRVDPVDIVTPVAPTTGRQAGHPQPLVVPILRAGLGMLDGMMRLLPTAEVGFLGMVRNEETLEASTYAERLPDDLSGRQCYVLDPMLATGGTLAAAIRFLTDRGADDITAICLLAAPEGCASARAGARGLTCRSPSSPRRWTRGSTRRATSCPGSATRATGCTASRSSRGAHERRRPGTPAWGAGRRTTSTGQAATGWPWSRR